MFYDIFLGLCNSNHISPTAVLEKIGINKSNNTRWSNGSIPTDKNLKKLADYFCVTVEYLKGEDEKKTAQSELPLPNEIDAIVASCSKLSLEKLKVILDICRILNQEQDS